MDRDEEALAMFGESGFTKSAFSGGPINYSETSVIRSEGVVTKIYYEDISPMVDVELARGGMVRKVVFPGGVIDEKTKNLHGDYIPPTEGQKVIISFTGGDMNSPYISDLIFRAGTSEFSKLYKTFHSDKKIKKDEIHRGHKSGSYHKFTDKNIESGYNEEEDSLGSSKIEQKKDGINLGKGGVGGVKSPIALVNENMVMTMLGLMPIQPAQTRQGTLEVTVKA